LLFFSVISKHLPWLNAFAGVFRQSDTKIHRFIKRWIFVGITKLTYSKRFLINH